MWGKKCHFTVFFRRSSWRKIQGFIGYFYSELYSSCVHLYFIFSNILYSTKLSQEISSLSPPFTSFNCDLYVYTKPSTDNKNKSQIMMSFSFLHCRLAYVTLEALMPVRMQPRKMSRWKTTALFTGSKTYFLQLSVTISYCMNIISICFYYHNYCQYQL